MNEFFLKSKLFQIEPNEDEHTNPNRYGKQLSNWLKYKLSHLGYNTEVVSEDWGWCVICARKPYLLWIGCGNMDDDEYPNNSIGNEEIIWHCFVETEIPFISKIFGKSKIEDDVTKLKEQIKNIFESEPGIELAEITEKNA